MARKRKSAPKRRVLSRARISKKSGKRHFNRDKMTMLQVANRLELMHELGGEKQVRGECELFFRHPKYEKIQEIAVSVIRTARTAAKAVREGEYVREIELRVAVAAPFLFQK